MNYYDLGYHHQFISRNFNKMEMYYLKAIEQGDVDAMFNLGFYYFETENNEGMNKYLGMASIQSNKAFLILKVCKLYEYFKNYSF